MLVRFVVSGLVSSASASLFIAMIALGMVGGPVAMLLGLVGGVGGIIPAVTVAGIPAILLGGLLWTTGARHPWARRHLPWAAIGACVGLGVWALSLVTPIDAMAQLRVVARLTPTQLSVALTLAGAGAALMFRANMKLLMLFSFEGEEGT